MEDRGGENREEGRPTEEAMEHDQGGRTRRGGGSGGKKRKRQR